MNKQVHLFLVFAAIWFIASLLNGLLNGIYAGIFISTQFGNLADTIFLSILFSFVFSIPFVGATWLVACIAQAHGKAGFILFKIALQTTGICSVIVAFLFIKSFKSEFGNGVYIMCGCIIISAISTVLMFRKKIKNEE